MNVQVIIQVTVVIAIPAHSFFLTTNDNNNNGNHNGTLLLFEAVDELQMIRVTTIDVKLHLFQKRGQSFCKTSANFMDSLRTYDIHWESQVDETMSSFIVG